MGGRGGAWQSRKLSFCCCVPLHRCPASPKSPSHRFSLSLSLCVRVVFSCLLSPPLSLILLSACFSRALSIYTFLSFVPLISSFFLLFLICCLASEPLPVFFTKPGQGRLLLILHTKRLLCLLACLFGQLFIPPFSPTCLFPRSPLLPSSVPGWGVCVELETLAGRAAENESTKQQNASA